MRTSMITSFSKKQVKFWSMTLLTSFWLQFIIPAAEALAGEGPAKPEAAQFEPVDASDLVNLFTGDFTYNVPLLEVPGPEGNWPVNLSYHAGVGPNTEATWVGLGWTLNPGSINRFVSGYPDDYYAGSVISTYEIDKQSGWGVGIGIGYGPFGMNMNFENGKGLTGWNASVSVMAALNIKSPIDIGLSVGSEGMGMNVGIGLGENAKYGSLGISVNSSGVGLSYSMGTDLGNNMSLGGSIGVNLSNGDTYGGGGISRTYGKGTYGQNSMSLMGVSWSNRQAGANFSFAGTGFSSISKGAMGQGHMSSSSFTIPLPLGNTGAWLSLSYWEWEWYLKEKHFERAFGILHQTGFLNIDKVADSWEGIQDNILTNYSLSGTQLIANDPVIIPDYSVNSTNGTNSTQSTSSSNGWDFYYDTKFERNLINSVLTSSEDIYQVSAQGLGGSFRPYMSYAYVLKDESGENNDGHFAYYNYNNEDFKNSGGEIKFRFDADAGGNFISETSDLGFGLNNLVSIENNRGSRKIEPAVDTQTGELLGFRITSEDGKVYEFFKPVYSYYQYSETNQDNQHNTHTMSTPYATSWLITAVKGPDYLDVAPYGLSDNDYGFWVGFEYSADQFYGWKTPYSTEYDKVKSDIYAKSYGLKSSPFLTKIYTATHSLNFNTTSKNDNLSSKIDEIKISINKIGKSRYVNDPNGVADGYPDHYYYSDFYISKAIWQSVKDIANALPGTKIYFRSHSYVDSEGQFCDVVQSYACNPQSEWVDNTDVDVDVTNTWSNLSSINNGTEFKYQSSNWTGHQGQLGSSYIGEIPITICSIECRTFLYAEIVLKRPSGSIYFGDQNKTLTSVDLINKSNNKLVEKVKFNTSYQLQYGTENSSDKAFKSKLCLNSIQKFGSDGTTAVMPATVFRYANNPNWNKHSYDLWNGYTRSGNESKHFNSQVKSEADQDASAWNLSSIQTPLGSTINVEYESDKIDYVGKYYVPDFGNIQEIAIPSNAELVESVDGNYKNVTVFSTSLSTEMMKSNGYIILQKHNRSYTTTASGVGLCERPNQDTGDWESDHVFFVERDQSYVPSSNYVHLKTPVQFNMNSTKPPIEIYCTAVGDGIDWSQHDDYKYYLVGMKEVYGGGHRVKSINITDNQTTKKTVYGYGKGVTAVLPSDYKEFDQSSLGKIAKIDLPNLYVDGKFNQLSQSAGVGYEYVDVYDVNPNTGAMLNGKTRTSFYTTRDFGVNFDESVSGKITITDLSGINGKMKSIEFFRNDNQLAKKDELIYRFSHSTSPVIMGIEETETGSGGGGGGGTGGPEALTMEGPGGSSNDPKYNVYNASLLTDYIENHDRTRKIMYNDGSSTSYLNSNQPLGLTQQRYISNNKGTVKKIEHVRENVYLVGTKSTTYFYNSTGQSTGQQVMTTENIGFDALTGATLVTQSSNSKDQQMVSENTPAYWNYSGMRDKNMLSQMSEAKSYLLPSNVDFWLAKANQSSLDQQYLKSDNITTWRDWGYGVWRQNDTYSSIAFGSNYTPFSSWDNYSDWDAESHQEKVTISPDKFSNWQRTSNITQYDFFGHPVEERGLDGNYTSSLYSYSGSLPVAIVKNARISRSSVGADASYLGMESGQWQSEVSDNDYWALYTTPGYNDLVSDDANTGKYSIKIDKDAVSGGEPTYGPTKDFLPSKANQTGKFKVSAWVKTESGFGAATSGALLIHSKVNSSSNNNAYPTTNGTTPANYIRFSDTNGKWKYIEGIIDVGAIRQQSGLSATEDLRLRVFPINENSSKYFLIDDIRVYPVNASMSTFAYDPVTWKVTAMTDENNVTTYYEYDKAGRLAKVLDQDKNILNRYTYHYKRP